MKKWIRPGLFVIICAVILWMTLNRKPGMERQFQPALFWSYRLWLTGDSRGRGAVAQNLNNIILFIPFGFFFPKKNWKSVLIGAVIFSGCIELTQWAFKLGLAEFDDVISNTAGAAIGFAILLLVKGLKKNMESSMHGQ